MVGVDVILVRRAAAGWKGVRVTDEVVNRQGGWGERVVRGFGGLAVGGDRVGFRRRDAFELVVDSSR